MTLLFEACLVKRPPQLPEAPLLPLRCRFQRNKVPQGRPPTAGVAHPLPPTAPRAYPALPPAACRRLSSRRQTRCRRMSSFLGWIGRAGRILLAVWT